MLYVVLFVLAAMLGVFWRRKAEVGIGKGVQETTESKALWKRHVCMDPILHCHVYAVSGRWKGGAEEAATDKHR